MKKFIFALIEKDTKKVRYIGSTVDPIRKYRYLRYQDQTELGEWCRSNSPELKAIGYAKSIPELRKKVGKLLLEHGLTLYDHLIKKRKIISVRFFVDEDQFKLLKDLSEQNGQSLSEFIRSRTLK